jgi:hypothetical protein
LQQKYYRDKDFQHNLFDLFHTFLHINVRNVSKFKLNLNFKNYIKLRNNYLLIY